MKTFTLNIGLLASQRFPKHAQNRVLRECTPIACIGVPYIASAIISDLQDAGFDVQGYGIIMSGTEPTLVVKCDTYIPYGAIRALIGTVATRYAQDCVALSFNDGTTGELIGEYSELWGEFNAEFFIPSKGVRA